MASKTIIVDVSADLAAFIAAAQKSPDYTLKGEPIYKLTPEILKQFVNASIIKENHELKEREEDMIQQSIESCSYDMPPGPAKDDFALLMRKMMTGKPLNMRTK